MKFHNHQLPVTWNNSELDNFQWLETFMIDEIPSTDQWDTVATKNKLNLEEIYKKHHLPKECSKHFMCLKPDLSSGLRSLLDTFNSYQYHYNFLKLTPGYNVWMHYDSYSTFLKFNNIDESNIENIHRTAIFMTDHSDGQVLQIGKDVYSNWSKGTAFTWKGSTWHGAANFGFKDLIVMQITWI